jgi:hypothetical protein
MLWHDAGRLAFQIATPLAAIRILTWLVALFGSDRLSKRAMSLLRRRAPAHEDSSGGTRQTSLTPVLSFIPAARKTFVADVDSGQSDDVGPTECQPVDWADEAA